MYQTVQMHDCTSVSYQARTLGKRNYRSKVKNRSIDALEHTVCIFTTMATALRVTIVHTQYENYETHPKSTIWNAKIQYSKNIN